MALKWKGNLVFEQVVEGLIAGLDEVNDRIVGEAQQELYPKHGVLTGRLRRSLQRVPARRQGNKVVGGVGAAGVIYARPVHKLYRYFTIGLDRVRPKAPEILKKHVARKQK